MTWFLKVTVSCATFLLLGFALDVLGHTLFMCKQDCKDEPDDPVCSRWNFTADDSARTKHSDYQWLRNDCERKCFQHGTYERAEPMELCYQKGQNRTTYICSRYWQPKKYEKCMTNVSWQGN